MACRRYIFQCTLAVLAVCAVAFGSQSQKRAAPQAQKPLPTLSAQEIFKRVSPSVMVVESLDAAGKVTVFGSGVVIAPGRVITNRHVIEDGVSFRVVHNDKKWPAKLIKVDPDHDLAELSVAGLDAPAVSVLDSSKLAVGETVYAIGAPEGLELTISEGLISGLRDFDKSLVIQTSAAISPGSSGGGLFDADGRLVGITTFYLKEGQSLNFALPAEWTLALNNRLPRASPTGNQDSPEFQALAWLEVGWTLEQNGKYEEAARAYQEALNLRPGLEDAVVGLGLAYGHLGQLEKAVSFFQEALRLKSNDEVAWTGLGLAYDQLKQYDKAADAEQQALRLKPDDAGTWAMLGLVYDDLGRHGKAISAEQEALRLKPDEEFAWFRLGIAYGNIGQFDKAAEAERRAVSLMPSDASAWFDLGISYRALGQQTGVIKVYEELKTLNPKMAEDFFKAAVLP